jgi:Short C-terminal domain
MDSDLTSEGQSVVEEAARRFSVSQEAVQAILKSLVASGGHMAQFSHPALGGLGQWSSGGMIMIGDMFNADLKARVAGLCAYLSDLVRRTDVDPARPAVSQSQSQGGSGGTLLPAGIFFRGEHTHGNVGGNWWPDELGVPASTGAQNTMRYANFPDRHRLALDLNGRVSVHDTGDHWITGFSQQQSGDQTLTFTSQHGAVRLDSLPQVAVPGRRVNEKASPDRPAEAAGGRTGGSPATTHDILDSITKLADLRDTGVISDAEFSAKKAELLARL